MATTKFKIFCDEQPQRTDEKRTNLQADNKKTLGTILNAKLIDVKREPLGLRQTASHAIPSSTATTTTSSSMSQTTAQQARTGPLQPLAISSTTTIATATNTNTSSSTSTSATNTTLTSTDEEDQENDISMASLGSDFVPSILHDNDYDDENVDDNYDVDQSFDIDDEEDFEADKERKLELDKALMEHDESQLFNCTDYANEIIFIQFNLQGQPDLRPLPNYLELQSEIDSMKRAILIKWLVEVNDEFELVSETLFIAIGLIDRFLSKMSIPSCNFQLLGVAAMFTASKYEEVRPPELTQFIEITDFSYSRSQILQMEREVLKALDFRLSFPTITFFLREIFASNKFSRKVYDLAEYLCYLSLLIDQPFLEYYPSEVAVAAVILAAYELDAKGNISSDLWSAYDKSNTDQLNRRACQSSSSFDNNKTSNSNKRSKQHMQDVDRRTCIIDNDLPLCIEALLAIQKMAHSKLTQASEDSSVTMDDFVIEKFSSPDHNKVALLTPPEEESLLQFHERD